MLRNELERIHAEEGKAIAVPHSKSAGMLEEIGLSAMRDRGDSQFENHFEQPSRAVSRYDQLGLSHGFVPDLALRRLPAMMPFRFPTTDELR